MSSHTTDNTTTATAPTSTDDDFYIVFDNGPFDSQSARLYLVPDYERDDCCTDNDDDECKENVKVTNV